jgi:cytochrome c-type biogenesis protein CcmH
LGPSAFLLIGVITVFLLARSKKAKAQITLDKLQQTRLNDILQKGEED